MRLTVRDVSATVLVAAIGVPYVGYLVRGEWPLIEDPHGMAGTALVLGVTGYLVMAWGDTLDLLGRVETTLAVAGLAIGVTAYELGTSGAAEVVLALFMISILVLWALKVADHAGLLHRHNATEPMQPRS